MPFLNIECDLTILMQNLFGYRIIFWCAPLAVKPLSAGDRNSNHGPKSLRPGAHPRQPTAPRVYTPAPTRVNRPTRVSRATAPHPRPPPAPGAMPPSPSPLPRVPSAMAPSPCALPRPPEPPHHAFTPLAGSLR